MIMLLVGALFVSLPATGSRSGDRISEICSGTEIVQVGSQPARTVPYSLDFSADLTSGRYCYDRCGPDQSYPISDTRSSLIVLASLDHGGQVRHLTYDRRAQSLSDDQRFDAPLVGTIIRKAVATCKAAPFHVPAP
jgi:hypothetical protein